jgi:hypothetical protein
MTPFRRAVLAMLSVLAPWSTLEAAPIEVRLVEGTAHGLMLARSVGGEILGHGDFLQAVHGDRVETRLVLRFKDGSLHDETHAFSQQRVFLLLAYRLVQRGPSFPETLDAAFDRKTGSYQRAELGQGNGGKGAQHIVLGVRTARAEALAGAHRRE